MRRTLLLAATVAALALPATASAVVGGSQVQTGAYPYAVAVGDMSGAFCGGALISPRVVLTAAHCLTKRRTALAGLRVLVGTPSLRNELSTADAEHVLGVTAVVVHPKFSLATMHYDAALLVLDHAVAGVAIVPLAATSPAAGAKVSAAGWGKTTERASSVPAHLRSVALEIAPTHECRRGTAALGTYFPPSMLCASAPGRDTCAGDSGGPLVTTIDGHVVLVGVTSFGVGCARAGHAGVYTRASAIRAWTIAQLALVATAFPAAG